MSNISKIILSYVSRIACATAVIGSAMYLLAPKSKKRASVKVENEHKMRFAFDDIIEMCVSDIQSALAARRAGCNSLELCSDRSQGGITPSFGLVQECVRRFGGSMNVHVLVRPRAGNFVYNDEEFDVLCRDVVAAKACNADGIVVGVLNEDGTIDVERMLIIRELAGDDMYLTFHRAFDVVTDPFTALSVIYSTVKCDRLLTSGLRSTALAGTSMIRELQIALQSERASSDTERPFAIIAAAGITVENAETIIRTSGCSGVHAGGSLHITISSLPSHPTPHHQPGSRNGTPFHTQPGMGGSSPQHMQMLHQSSASTLATSSSSLGQSTHLTSASATSLGGDDYADMNTVVTTGAASGVDNSLSFQSLTDAELTANIPQVDGDGDRPDSRLSALSRDDSTVSALHMVAPEQYVWQCADSNYCALYAIVSSSSFVTRRLQYRITVALASLPLTRGDHPTAPTELAEISNEMEQCLTCIPSPPTEWLATEMIFPGVRQGVVGATVQATFRLIAALKAVHEDPCRETLLRLQMVLAN